MAREIQEWPTAAADMDFDIADGGQPEGMKRSDVNNSGRERMRALRNFYDDGSEFLDLMRNPTDGSAFVVSKNGPNGIRIASGATDMSSFFNVNRRVRLTDAGATLDDFNVVSASYSNPNTDVVLDSTTSSDTDGVLLHAGRSLGLLAWEDSTAADFVAPTADTAAGIQAAYASLSPDGGTILLARGVTYDLEAQLLFDGDYSVQIWGQGTGSSILLATAATNLSAAIVIDGTNGGRISFEGFTLDGNRSGQTTGTGDGFFIQDGAKKTRFDNVEILSTRGNGIVLFGNPSSSIVIDSTLISNVVMDDIGGNGILASDQSTVDNSNTIDNLRVNNFGQETGISATSSGVEIAGEGWTLSNIRCTGLDLGGGFTQTGITFGERLAIDPNSQDARNCTMAGFYVEGTGVQSVGVAVNGEFNAISAGTIKMSGSTSYGIWMNGTGGARTPQYNVIDGVSIHGTNVGVLLAEASDFNALSNLSIFHPLTNGVLIQGGDDNRFSDIYINGNFISTPAVDLQTGSTGNVFDGLQIHDVADEGFRNSSGSTNNTLRNMSTDNVDTGIFVSSTTTGFTADGIRCLNLDAASYVMQAQSGSSGSKLMNTTHTVGNLFSDPGEDIKFTNCEGLDGAVSDTDSGTGETGSKLFGSVTLSPPPNGTRQYQLTGEIFSTAASGDLLSMEFNLGSAGNSTDADLWARQRFHGDENSISRILIPGTNDTKVSASSTLQSGPGTGTYSWEHSIVAIYIEGT